MHTTACRARTGFPGVGAFEGIVGTPCQVLEYHISNETKRSGKRLVTIHLNLLLYRVDLRSSEITR